MINDLMRVSSVIYAIRGATLKRTTGDRQGRKGKQNSQGHQNSQDFQTPQKKVKGCATWIQEQSSEFDTDDWNAVVKESRACHIVDGNEKEFMHASTATEKLSNSQEFDWHRQGTADSEFDTE